ncbi:olfactory receptor 14J1-like [Tachyglossus aculeatus]|uniref:olfactory receptor 14J1-like n=1 Tax=Tachyglossus aculeatus TaxID=9261 RepID=UPI0018F41705|nr:olfactory receptor 14J1-like [Tachyglossus aculeatus]
MTNVSLVTNFLLMGFSDIRKPQVVHAALFLLAYLVSLTGNLLIITVTILDRHLHTPLYVFLKNLSFIDICYISSTVPKSIAISLTPKQLNILLVLCHTGLLLVVWLAASEFFVLTAMPYHRYAAVCRPLRYGGEMFFRDSPIPKDKAANALRGTSGGSTQVLVVIIYRSHGPTSNVFNHCDPFLTFLLSLSMTILLLGDFNTHMNVPGTPGATEHQSLRSPELQELQNSSSQKVLEPQEPQSNRSP